MDHRKALLAGSIPKTTPMIIENNTPPAITGNEINAGQPANEETIVAAPQPNRIPIPPPINVNVLTQLEIGREFGRGSHRVPSEHQFHGSAP